MNLPRSPYSNVARLLAGARLLVGCCIVAAPLFAQAQILGDLKELTDTAAAHADNLGKLKTWRGEVDFSYKRIHSTSESGERSYGLTEAKITFAIDVPGQRSRITVETTKDDVLTGEKATPRLALGTKSYMEKEGMYYDLHIFANFANRHVSIRKDPFRKLQGDTILTVHPMYFFTLNRTKLDERWMFFATVGNDPKFPGTGEITREEDLVALKVIPMRNAADLGWFKTTVDLSQGANPVRHEQLSVYVNAKNVTKYEWEWQKLGGMYVPSAYRHDSQTDGDKPRDDQIRLKWTKNIVNEPLDDEEFSLGKMGLRVGDLVMDERDRSQRKVTDPEQLK